jgi:hypothetical protein
LALESVLAVVLVRVLLERDLFLALAAVRVLRPVWLVQVLRLELALAQRLVGRLGLALRQEHHHRGHRGRYERHLRCRLGI